MLTTIRLDKEIQRQLKLRSVETGKSQLELANQYILEGLRNNKPSNMSLEEMDKLLAHDKPEGNNLRKFANLVRNSSEVDEVREKKETYRGMQMIFVDTCYLIALMNDKAKKHNEALTLLGLIENESTLINSTVLVEMLNNLNKKRYEAKRQDIIDLLYGMDNIHYLSEQDYNDSFKLWEQYDHSVNFSDCTITHTMQKHGVQNILSFDGDFDKINGINRIYL